MVPPQAPGGSFVVDMTGDDCRRAVISQEPQADPTDVVWAGRRFTLGATSAAPEEQSGENAQLLKSGDVLLPSYTKKRSAASPRRPRLTPSKHSRRRDDGSSDEQEPPLQDAFMRAARTTCYYYCGRRPSMRRAMALFGTLAVLATWRGRGGGLLT